MDSGTGMFYLADRDRFGMSTSAKHGITIEEIVAMTFHYSLAQIIFNQGHFDFEQIFRNHWGGFSTWQGF